MRAGGQAGAAGAEGACRAGGARLGGVLDEALHEIAAVHQVLPQRHDADLFVAPLPRNQQLAPVQQVIQLACTTATRITCCTETYAGFTPVAACVILLEAQLGGTAVFVNLCKKSCEAHAGALNF